MSSTSAAADAVFAREELRGTRALLGIRIGIAGLLIVSGLSATQRASYMLTNLIFAFAYILVVALEFYLHRRANLPALRRYAFFSVTADHAIFAFWIIHHYYTDGNGNFNYALKSPYMVLLLLPMLTTLLQYRLALLLVSFATYVLILLAFLGFGLLSQVPQSDSWQRYFLGDTIILPAWIGLWLPFSMLVAGIIAYSIVRTRRMAGEIGLAERRAQQLSRYFSPAVAQKILNAEEGHLLRGSRQRAAVLFADIHSFTSLSENMPPDEIASMLSALRQLQTSAVFRFHGTVDKFTGDALMAVFGAPTSAGSFAQDVTNSVQCALALLRDLEHFNAERHAAGKDSIRIGIGIHAGEVFAGNLGGSDQFEYTVVGDVVNKASRIQHLCKKVQAELLISETVARELPAEIITERLGVVKIRGHEKPMGIYRIQRGM
jgi:adenylate cyclase